MSSKISALTPATLPIDGTEQVPLAVGAGNAKITLQNLVNSLLTLGLNDGAQVFNITGDGTGVFSFSFGIGSDCLIQNNVTGGIEIHNGAGGSLLVGSVPNSDFEFNVNSGGGQIKIDGQYTFNGSLADAIAGGKMVQNGLIVE